MELQTQPSSPSIYMSAPSSPNGNGRTRSFDYFYSVLLLFTVVAVNKDIKVGDDVKIIDVARKFVTPGGIDPHTHLAMEFLGTETIDDYYSGQAAALAGGTTMRIDFVIPVNGSLSAGYEAYVKKAEKSCMDYGFHMVITKWDETVSKEMEIIVKDKGSCPIFVCCF